MKYEGAVYRPPSEARSLIIQATIGCSHNKCTFCSMYKDKEFRVRDIDEIIKDLELARATYKSVKRIFLADGDSLILKTKDLALILQKINQLFPECERVSIYGAPKNILNKSIDELKELNDLGLKIIYLGIESGSDKILKKVKKGVTADQMITAGQKVITSGIKLSTMIISGLGGQEDWQEHALKSAKVVNEINPDYLALLTLLIQKNTPLQKDIEDNKFNLLTPKEVLLETKLLIKNLKISNCIFRSNHASNYLRLAGTLSRDKDSILEKVDKALENNYDYKDESLRRL